MLPDDSRVRPQCNSAAVVADALRFWPAALPAAALAGDAAPYALPAATVARGAAPYALPAALPAATVVAVFDLVQ